MICAACPDCEKAETVNHGGYHSACLGCQARMLAAGPLFFESSRKGAMTPDYQRALVLVFGKNWKAGHERVKATRARMDAIERREVLL